MTQDSEMNIYIFFEYKESSISLHFSMILPYFGKISLFVAFAFQHQWDQKRVLQTPYPRIFQHPGVVPHLQGELVFFWTKSKFNKMQKINRGSIISPFFRTNAVNFSSSLRSSLIFSCFIEICVYFLSIQIPKSMLLIQLQRLN